MPRAEILFGLENGRKKAANIGVIVEGALDCISVWDALRNRADMNRYHPVAMMGNTMTRTQAQVFASEFDEAVLFFDNDEAGIVGEETTYNLLKEYMPLSVADYDVVRFHGKDPGDFRPSQVVKMLKSAYHFSEREVIEDGS
jgi:DNA primase